MGKKVKLNCWERLLLTAIDGGLLPKEGNAITVRVLKALNDKLPLSPEEMEEMGVTPTEMLDKDGNPASGLKFVVATKDSKPEEVEKANKYHEKRIEEKDILFLDGERSVVMVALKSLDTKEKLQPRHLTLWDKFVENWEKDDAK